MKPRKPKVPYTSKSFKLYLAAWHRFALCERMSDDLYTNVNRIGFAARLLNRMTGRPLPEPMVRKTPKVELVKPVYNRRLLYRNIPKHWPPPFLPPATKGGRDNLAAIEKLMKETTA